MCSCPGWYQQGGDVLTSTQPLPGEWKILNSRGLCLVQSSIQRKLQGALLSLPQRTLFTTSVFRSWPHLASLGLPGERTANRTMAWPAAAPADCRGWSGCSLRPLPGHCHSKPQHLSTCSFLTRRALLGPADLFLDHILYLCPCRIQFAALKQGSRRREQLLSVFN